MYLYNACMHATSHFIGISLDSSLFADLFVDLQTYFSGHGMESTVEFQNPLSPHVTLYYLEDSIEPGQKSQILEDISDASATNRLTISDLKANYFGEPGQERVCYLGCARDTKLEELHQFFVQKYNRPQIPENQLTFVPHISLFRIRDPEAYALHKEKIDAIIHTGAQIIDTKHAITGLRLFRVNSLFHPEIQIAI